MGKPVDVEISDREGVRSLDNDTPCKNDGKGVTSACDVVYYGGREQSELDEEKKISIQASSWWGEETDGVEDEVVNEPRGGDSKESDPVTLDDEPVGDLGVPHRIALEPLRFVHVYSPKKDGESRDEAKAEGETPDGPKVVGTKTVVKG